jgi:hypothetical protein
MNDVHTGLSECNFAMITLTPAAGINPPKNVAPVFVSQGIDIHMMLAKSDASFF